MQTFIFLLIGITFGYKIGIIIIMLYLFEGMVDLPVFASFFKYDKKIINKFLKLVFSVSFIYILGVICLEFVIGWKNLYLNLRFNHFY